MPRHVRLARRTALAVAAAVVPLLTFPAAHADLGAISNGGECRFGVGSGTPPLVLTTTSTGVTIQGNGSCQTSLGPTGVFLQLGGIGPFGCHRTAGLAFGGVYFNPQLPDSQPATHASAVIGYGTMELVITNDTGDFYADAQFAWPSIGGGCVTTALDGVMSFADS